MTIIDTRQNENTDECFESVVSNIATDRADDSKI